MNIQTLSHHQIKFLADLFFGADLPSKTRVEFVGITENGEMIVGYIKYGTMLRKSVPRNSDEEILESYDHASQTP